MWSRYAIERQDVLHNAKRYKRRTNKDGSTSAKPNVVYICAECQGENKEKEVQIDHITPVGKTPEFPAERNGDWVDWLNRVFCNRENLQVLCLTCHKKKSKEERKAT